MNHALLLMGLLLAGQVQPLAGENLKAEVRRLVRQLDSPQLAERDSAEAELLRRGPAVLGELPPVTEDMSAEVRQRLARVRQKLQRLAADAVANASIVTLQADSIPLSKALAELQRQSGNAIVDYREKFRQKATDPVVNVHFDKTPFWPALDQLLDQAGLTIYPFSEERAIYVVAATGKKRSAAGCACYNGPFRFEPIGIVARRDLRTSEEATLMVTIEAIWEPRLRIISLLQRMADVSAVDERGLPLPVADAAVQLEMPPRGQTNAVNLDLPFHRPPREVKQIANLRGKLTAMIPGKIETFHFQKLAEAKNIEQRIAGVAVTLEQVRKHKKASQNSPLPLEERPVQNSPLPLGEGQGVRAVRGSDRSSSTNPSDDRDKGTTWEVRMRVRFDDAGDSLASHRTWIFNNEAYLECPDGKRVAYGTFQTTAQGKDEVGIAYFFNVDKPLDAFTFVYKTPGTIVTRSFEYELKNLPLP